MKSEKKLKSSLGIAVDLTDAECLGAMSWLYVMRSVLIYTMKHLYICQLEILSLILLL